jgi:hypothetical protein
VTEKPDDDREGDHEGDGTGDGGDGTGDGGDGEGGRDGDQGSDRESDGQWPVTYRLRRAPRYARFGVTGTIVGVVIGAVLALSFSATADYSIRTIAGYFTAILGLVGCLTGLGAAVLIERRRS